MRTVFGRLTNTLPYEVNFVCRMKETKRIGVVYYLEYLFLLCRYGYMCTSWMIRKVILGFFLPGYASMLLL